MTKEEKLAQLEEIRNPGIRMQKILTDRAIAEAVLKMQTMIGPKGDPGYSPILGQDYFTESEIENIVSFIQSKVRDGKDGESIVGPQGPAGKEGYTPVRTVDYWTLQDQAQIIKEVLQKVKVPQDGISPKMEDIVSRVTDNLKKNPITLNDIKGTKELIAFLKSGGFRGGGGITSITGFISAGSGISLAGTGTNLDPYVISNSGVLTVNGVTGNVTFAAGSNITLTPLGNTITIASTGGGSSIALKTNGVANGSQSILNLKNGSNVTISDDGAGGITIAATSGSGLIIGTTAITSGTNTRVLFDNAGVVGEYAISGSGSVAMTTSPTFTTPVLGVASYTTLSGGNITDSALTAGRITFAGTAGILKDDSTLTYATSGGLLVNNVYAKFGTAAVPVPVTKGVDFYYTDNTTSGAEIGVGNTSNGTSAYAGVYLNNDLAVDGLVDHFGGIFMNSSGYTDTTFGTALAVANLVIIQNTDAPIAYCASHATLGAHIFYLGNTVVGGFATVATTNETGRWSATQGVLQVGLAGTALGKVVFEGSTSGGITVQGAVAGGSSVNTLQAVTDTFVYKNTTDTLTNKSISASQITTGTFGTGAYTMDTSLTVPQIVNSPNAITASGNAATATRANRLTVITNNSAAGLTITLSTTGAVAGDLIRIKSLPSSAVAQTITWLNTENSDVTPSANLNASTTSPREDGFDWNPLTSKWRCIASC